MHHMPGAQIFVHRIHSSITHISQQVETTQMSSDGRTDMDGCGIDSSELSSLKKKGNSDTC
jgi:hypothetical protein